MRLLLTRPQPDAMRSAAALRGRGHSVVVSPLLRIETLEDAEIGAGPWAAILVTSASSARAIARHKRFAELALLPVLAVGERSAQAMRAAGFAEVISASGNAGDLTRLAAERLQRWAPLLYAAAEDRSGDLAGALRARGFVVDMAVVYRAVVSETLPAEAVEALTGGIDGVLHFSHRTAETYLSAAGRTQVLESALKPVHYCLSDQVAEPLARAGAANIRIAPQPNETALIELIPAA